MVSGVSRPPTPLLLFVCSGNICRSAYAEAYARQLLAGSGIQVASAGTYGIAGQPPTGDLRAVAAEDGLDVRRHRSQGLTPGLAGTATLAYGMTETHLDGIAAAGGAERAALLDPSGGEIADPYGHPLQAYRTMRDQIREAIEARLDDWLALAQEPSPEPSG